MGKSLERIVGLSCLALWLLVLALCIYIGLLQGFGTLGYVTLMLCTLGPVSWICRRIYFRVTDLVDRFGLQLDSLGNEEYKSWHLAGYSDGRVASLKRDFDRLATKLANKRTEYLHNEGFLFEFIQQLKLPILVLDHHHQLYFATESFNGLASGKRPLEGLPARALGLSWQQDKWIVSGSEILEQRFEIMSQSIVRQGREYQILVFLSIERQLRDNEKEVWQKLVRVLNHEVRNSLTPIYSMSQSLLSMKQDPAMPDNPGQEVNILSVIEQRAHHLLNFVDSYSALTRLSPPNKRTVSVRQVCEHLQTIYPVLQWSAPQDVCVAVDEGQIQQALINLLKNAYESGSRAEDVQMEVELLSDKVCIRVRDKGHGITNPQNLFVPFYSTKKNGSGIGLVLSRELVRHQGGELSLKFGDDGIGTVAEVVLERPSAKG